MTEVLGKDISRTLDGSLNGIGGIEHILLRTGLIIMIIIENHVDSTKRNLCILINFL